MRPFQFHKITSHAAKSRILKEAVAPTFMAGGLTLVPRMRAREEAPTDVLDVTDMPGMRDIEITDMRFRLGAAVTYTDVVESVDLSKVCPAMIALAATIGDRHIQNRGTIGGSIARNDPASDYPAALIALNAIVETDARSIAAADFFEGPFKTALENRELITAVSFDTPTASAYVKFPYPANGYAMVGVFLARHQHSVAVAVNGAGRHGVFRLNQLEQRLNENLTRDAVSDLDLSSFDILEDRHGPRAYRENLIRVTAQRAIAQCATDLLTLAANHCPPQARAL